MLEKLFKLKQNQTSLKQGSGRGFDNIYDDGLHHFVNQ